MIIISVLILCVLIFVHELGHFLLAKWNKVGVLAFSIGFGPVLWKKQIGETTYSLRLLPLGGFVRMVGDDPRASDPNFKLEESEDKASPENLKAEEFTPEQKALLEDRSRWFMLKGYWPKFSIVFAGPAFNFIFAIILGSLMVGIYGQGKPVNTPIIGDVVPGLPAADAGLQADDMVLSLDGAPVETWEQLSSSIRGSGGKPIEMLVERTTKEGIEKVTLKVVPEADRSGLVSDEERVSGDVYRVGIIPSMVKEPVSFSEALEAGPRITWSLTAQTLLGLKGMILGHISSDNIAGPVRIFQEAGRSASKGFEYVLSFMIFLNVSLAVLNLLPIPVLDGGHLFFFTVEAFKGSPINIRVREIATQVGMFLLLALMVFALGNDLFR